MPVDPTISLHAEVPNPLSTIGSFATIQNQLNQNRLFQQTFAARQKAGQILAGAPDLESGLNSLLQDPTTAPFAGEVINSVRSGQQTLADIQRLQAVTQGEYQTQATNGLQAFFKSLPAVMADPSDAVWDNNVNAHLATLSPQARGRVSPAIDSIKRALMGGLPEDPAQRRAQFNQRLAGFMTAGGITKEGIESIMGVPTTLDLGGYKQPGLTLPAQLGGGFAPSGGPLAMTPPAANVSGDFGPGGAPTVARLPGQGPPGAPTGPGPAAGSTAGFPAGTTSDVNDRGQTTWHVPQPANDLQRMPGANGVVGNAKPVEGNALGGAQPPAARTGGAPTGLTRQQQKYTDQRMDAIGEYESDLDDRVNTGATFYRNMNEIILMAKQAATGGGAEAYMKLGQALQALGVNNSTVDAVANGSLEASQVIDKASLSNTMNQLKQQLTGIGGSRINQQEFVAQLSKNPNLATDPRAIVEVFNLWNDFYNRDKAEQVALDKYKQQGGDLARWPATWNQSEFMKGFAPGSSFTGEGVKGIGKGKPQTVKTPEEARKLPPGTHFLTPDGREMIR